MTARLLEMPRKSVAEPCAGAKRPALLLLLERALDRVWDTHKAAAIDLGVSEGQLSKWLSGREKFGLVDLERSRALRGEVVRMLAEESGLDVRALDARQRRRKQIEKLQRELFVLQDEEMREAV